MKPKFKVGDVLVSEYSTIRITKIIGGIVLTQHTQTISYYEYRILKTINRDKKEYAVDTIGRIDTYYKLSLRTKLRNL